jgi:hypothetical protein
MQYLSPSQSVSDVRFFYSAGHTGPYDVMLTLSTPGTLVSSLTNSPATLTWS